MLIAKKTPLVSGGSDFVAQPAKNFSAPSKADFKTMNNETQPTLDPTAPAAPAPVVKEGLTAATGETPRTDAFVKALGRHWHDWTDEQFHEAYRGHAYVLERELAKARQREEQLRETNKTQLKQHAASIAGWCEENDELRADLETSKQREAEARKEVEDFKQGLKTCAEIFGEKALLYEKVIRREAIPIQPYREKISKLEADLAAAIQERDEAKAELKDAEDLMSNADEREKDLYWRKQYEEACVAWGKRLEEWEQGERDTQRLDLIEQLKGRCGYSESTYVGEGFYAYDHCQGDKYFAAKTLRGAIDELQQQQQRNGGGV